MPEPLTVTNEQMAAYQDTVGYWARRFQYFPMVEYDDLFQEGWMSVLEALQAGLCPSKDIIRKKMATWVSYCAKRGLTWTKEVPEWGDVE